MGIYPSWDGRQITMTLPTIKRTLPKPGSHPFSFHMQKSKKLTILSTMTTPSHLPHHSSFRLHHHHHHHSNHPPSQSGRLEKNAGNEANKKQETYTQNI